MITFWKRKGEMKRCKDWVVVFQNLETGKVKLDTFTEKNETEACKCFRACYRHENYRILTVVEKPEIAIKE